MVFPRVTVSRDLVLAFSWAWLLLFSIVPLGIILVIALARPADTVPPFSFAADPGNFAIAATDELYRTAFWLSLRTAAISTVICLLIGYPMALAIARAAERWRGPLLLALMLPFWTGFLMRINAWIGMLRDDGWINAALTCSGLRAGAAALHRHGAVYRHGLHLPAVHGAADLRAAGETRCDVAGGGGRSRRLAVRGRSCA